MFVAIFKKNTYFSKWILWVLIELITSALRGLNIFYIMFRIIAFFIIITILYASIGFLLSGDPWVHKTRLSPPQFIEMPVQAGLVSGHIFVC